MTGTSSLRILIVDDELPAVEMLQRFFQNTDHFITSAHNSTDALAIIREFPLDLIISDINMPDMDGVQLMREALSGFPFLNFILITGDSCSRSFDELKEAGALTCLAKPFRRSELMEIVDWIANLKKTGKLTSTQHIDTADRAQALQMNKSLWNRDQQFHAIMNTAYDAIILLDGNGNISFWNSAAEVMFGYRSHEAVGKYLHSLIAPQKYRKSAEIGVKEFAKTGEGSAVGKIIEITGLRKDQSEFPAELSLSGFKYQDTWHAVGIVRDISSRKESEESLHTAYSEINRLYQNLNREYDLANIFFRNVFQKSQQPDKNIKYYLSSLGTAGGDFFLSTSGVGGMRYSLLGDFTGHGLSAALGAIPVSSIFHTMAKKGHPLVNIIREINRNLNKILPTGLFFCGCMVELNNAHQTVRMMNFGLPIAIIVNDNGVIKNRVPSRHLPLGILPDIDREFHSMEFPLQHRDRIYIFTDGITEARNKDGEEFGQERLEHLLTICQFHEHSFDEICRNISEFRGDTPQLDDMAIAEITCDTSDVYLPAEEITSVSDLPVALNLSLTIHPSTMQAAHTLETITELFVEMHIEARKQKQNIFLILSELYSNALEHGILLMDSKLKNEPNGFEKYFTTRAERLAALRTGWIKLDMELMVQDTTGRVLLCVEDSGQGFDFQLIPTVQPDFSSFGGRGLYLVRSLCKDLIIEGIGNKVTAILEW